MSQLKEKIVAVKAQVRKLHQIERQMLQSPDQQVSLTDPDARSMATSGRGTGIVGYNVQTVVDTEHHMIVAHEVTNVGHDRTQLTNMATTARDAIGHQEMTALRTVAISRARKFCSANRPVSGRWCRNRSPRAAKRMVGSTSAISSMTRSATNTDAPRESGQSGA